MEVSQERNLVLDTSAQVPEKAAEHTAAGAGAGAGVVMAEAMMEVVEVVEVTTTVVVAMTTTVTVMMVLVLLDTLPRRQLGTPSLMSPPLGRRAGCDVMARL